MIPSTSTFKAAADVRYRLVDGKGVLIRQRVGEVLVLNRVGARILDLLQTGAPLRGVLETMVKEFEVGPAELERDAVAFVERLVEAGIVEEVPGR